MSEYIIYLRKSRADNDTESIEEVLARHERQLQEYALLHFGYHIAADSIYREVVSGETIEDRPKIKEVLREIEKEEVKGVLVIDPQRLSRGDLLDCGTIVHIFRYTNTLILTPTKTYNLADKMDRKFFEMELGRGSDYLEYTKEILSRGRIASVKEGNYIGSITPYGYDKERIERHPTLKINEEEAKIVKLIFELYTKEKLGYATIAHKLDELGCQPRSAENWRPVVIRDILCNPVYIGKVFFNRRKTYKGYENGKIVKRRPRANTYLLADGRHKAIIDDETWHKAQKRLNNNPRVQRSLSLINPLSGLLYCKTCGKIMVYRQYSKKGKISSNPRLLCTNQVHCRTKSAAFSQVYDAVLSSLQDALRDFEMKYQNNTASNQEMYRENIKHLEEHLKKLEERQEELYDLLESKIYTREIFIKRNQKLDIERKKLEKALSLAQEKLPRIVDISKKIKTFHEVIDKMQDETVCPELKNKLLKEIIEKIEYTNCQSGQKRLDGSSLQVEIFFREF